MYSHMYVCIYIDTDSFHVTLKLLFWPQRVVPMQQATPVASMYLDIYKYYLEIVVP